VREDWVAVSALDPRDLIGERARRDTRGPPAAIASALGSAFALAGAGSIAGRPLRANTTFGISFIGGANASVEYWLPMHVRRPRAAAIHQAKARLDGLGSGSGGQGLAVLVSGAGERRQAKEALRV
jgi:hypothetical protein